MEHYTQDWRALADGTLHTSWRALADGTLHTGLEGTGRWNTTHRTGGHWQREHYTQDRRALADGTLHTGLEGTSRWSTTHRTGGH